MKKVRHPGERRNDNAVTPAQAVVTPAKAGAHVVTPAQAGAHVVTPAKAGADARSTVDSGVRRNDKAVTPAQAGAHTVDSGVRRNDDDRRPGVRRNDNTASPARLHFPLDARATNALVRAALEEDRAFADVTTLATIPARATSSATLVARADGVVSGLPLAIAAFRQLDRALRVTVHAPDGTRVARGTPVLTLRGRTRALLSAERVALNFVQRLSGVATLTARYVEAVRGTGAKILDTRKTTPGWRALEKYAVRCGGGVNHRSDLEAEVLIKDNHLAALEGDIARAVQAARLHAARGIVVEVECDDLEQVRAAAQAGADIVLLDNMSPALMKECVAAVAGRALTEASGGITLDTVRAAALAGVDRISVGALTHSAPALDLALDFAAP